MSSIADSSVTIQTSAQSVPSTPSWFGEVAAFAQVLNHLGLLKAIQEHVRFARARFGQYDTIDFVVVLIGYALSGERTLILPEASTVMMNRFLEEVSRVSSTHFVVMQVDGAGWHRANDLVIPENIRLIPQPAYSPELNPVEHIWDELREKYFHLTAAPQPCLRRGPDCLFARERITTSR